MLVIYEILGKDCSLLRTLCFTELRTASKNIIKNNISVILKQNMSILEKEMLNTYQNRLIHMGQFLSTAVG